MSTSSTCDWCQKVCKPRRCTRCYQAAFCSRDCQREDWNAREQGHRIACDAIYSARRSDESSGLSSGHQLPAPIPQSDDVEAAENELQTILSSRLANMSVNEVQEEYYKTMDAIQQVESVLAKNQQEKSEVDANSKATKPKVGSGDGGGDGGGGDSSEAGGTFSTNQLMPLMALQQKSHIPPAKQLKRTIPSVFECVAENYQCLIERLPHVSCYSITLTRRAKTGICDSLSDRLRLSIGPGVKDKSTRVLLSLADAVDSNSNGDQQVLLSASLPGQIIPNAPDVRLGVDDNDGSITMRLPCTSDLVVHAPHVDNKELNSKASTDERWANVDDGEDFVAATFSASDTKELVNLSCRSCGHRLLAKDANLNGVFPLPIGCWDEVADYLTCYEGQPVFDFGSKSTVADRGIVLEDESVMVLNKEDLGQNVCVLAIDGFGESEEELKGNKNPTDDTANTDETLPSSSLVDLDAVKNGAEFRGLRKWRDAVGGATLCCSQCCATLGFASLENVEACRLFKHRLSLKTRDESQGATKDVLSENTCTSFLAKDMIRYAESQAVFTFVITAGRTGGNTVDEGLGEAKEKGCLLLKILSWDTVVAKSSYSENKQYSTPMTRGVKVIYEFVDDYEDKIGGGRSSGKAENIEDVMSWTWGGVDLCCPPMANNKSRHQEGGGSVVQTTSPPGYGKASVQIFLTDEELAQVKSDLLAGSSLFSQAVDTSTLLLKLGADGKKEFGDTSKGLSVILLR